MLPRLTHRANRFLFILVSFLVLFTLLSSSNFLSLDNPISILGFNRRIKFCVRQASDINDIISYVATLPVDKRVPLRCNGVDYVVVDNVHTIEAASQNANMMYILGSNIGPELDQFVWRNSRWAIDIKGGDGYEVLIATRDSKRIALQNELDYLQSRCTNYFHTAKGKNGFGSNWHALGLGLAYSLYYNMTLFPTVQSKHFLPVTSCTEDQMNTTFAINPPLREYSKWDQSTVNFESPPDAEIFDLMSKKEIINSAYKRKGHFWYRSILTNYIVRPNHKMRDNIRKNSLMRVPCTSIHVRHSDKSIESAPREFPEYMKNAEEIRKKTGIHNIYLMSDDPEVIDSTKSAEYSNFQFTYLTMERTNAGWKTDASKGISLDIQEEHFILDLFAAANCEYQIVTYTSNIGRLIAELSYAIHDKEPNVRSLDYHWVMDP